MKNILFLLISLWFVSCTTVEDDCGCTPPPEPDETLLISLVNSENENLLSENTNNYLPDSLFTFYMLINEKVSNLTQRYGNANFILNFGTNENPNNLIELNYSWLLYSNNKKEGSYVIDYNNRFPNDTIFLKYDFNENEKSDRIIEVKLNGVTQQTESIDNYYRNLVIVK